MGRCSGTEVFDHVAKDILECRLSHDWKVRILTSLVTALENHDWDCHSDSKYYTDSIVTEVFANLHPTWYSPKQRILDKIKDARERKLYRDEETALDLLIEIEGLIKRDKND